MCTLKGFDFLRVNIPSAAFRESGLPNPGLRGVKGEISISQSGKPMSFEEEKEREAKGRRGGIEKNKKGSTPPEGREGEENWGKANFRIN